MAIYTNYGRYIKAKQFKEALESQGDTYMLFGMGNPQWDSSSADQDIPIAPYNTSIISDTTANNQFTDDTANLFFNNSINIPIQALSNGSPITNPTNEVAKYIDLCKNNIPPFPCIFKPSTGDGENVLVSKNSTITVNQSTYQNYYIVKENNSYIIKDYTATNHEEIILPPDDSLSAQYFSEAYIRGIALNNHISKPPVGLIGAVKCNVELVKDIGGEGSSLYTGGIDQFWYGDRYWQTVDPNENIGINESGSYIESDDSSNQEVYPHHLIFTSTVNPRTLCSELFIDQHLVPRQIAIYTKERKPLIRNDGGDDYIVYSTEDGKINISYEENPLYYRAYENVFNFGQYKDGEITTSPIGEVLNFTIKCDCTLTSGSYITPNGEFKYVLNDYIRGQVRERHSIDRFGYIIGF